MQAVIIADASCLILLDKIGELELLQQVYGHIMVTDTVAKKFGLPLPAWATVQNPQNSSRLELLELALDLGEASAIALALEQAECLLIIDELRGRRVAQQLRLNITGTFGVLVRAKQNGLISMVKPLLTRIRQTNFRLSTELENQVLRLANEL